MLEPELTPEEEKARKYYDETFYSKKDLAHRINYADYVYNNMLSINAEFDLGLEQRIIFFCAYLHGIGIDLVTNKNDFKLYAWNHTISGKDDFILNMVNKNERELIADIVLELYPAARTAPIYNYVMVLHLAIIGEPSLTRIIRRTIQMHISDIGKEDSVTVRSYNYIVAMYSRTGYLSEDKLYVKFYEEELEDMWKAMEAMSEETLKNVIFKSLSEIVNDL